MSDFIAIQVEGAEDLQVGEHALWDLGDVIVRQTERVQAQQPCTNNYYGRKITSILQIFLPDILT